MTIIGMQSMRGFCGVGEHQKPVDAEKVRCQAENHRGERCKTQGRTRVGSRWLCTAHARQNF